MPAGYVDKQQQPPCVSSIDAAAQAASRRSAANASSVTFTAHVGSWTQTCLKNIWMSMSNNSLLSVWPPANAPYCTLKICNSSLLTSFKRTLNTYLYFPVLSLRPGSPFSPHNDCPMPQIYPCGWPCARYKWFCWIVLYLSAFSELTLLVGRGGKAFGL